MKLRIATDSLARLKQGRTIALTGAGISADSGMPTFRGNNGLWKKYRPEELATPSAFSQNPQLVWEWYSWRLEKLISVVPNEAHFALAQLEKMEILELIISQNVDDLHERAGTSKILKLHGSIIHTKCIECNKKEQIAKPPRAIPYCECGGMLRPDVVWFGESLSPKIQDEAFQEAATCDNMLIIGTSGIVYPAAFLPNIAKKEGAMIIEFNVAPTAITPLADYFIAAPAAESLPKFLANFQS
ncbi:MAG: NAD-dependent protein deacylase [Candidatus Heimdallarchaeota archaeon]